MKNEMKSVVLKKHELASGEKSELKNFWVLSDCQDVNKGTEMIVLVTQCSPNFEDFSMATLTEEIKLLVMEKYKFSIQIQ